ncbi:serine/threonine-protein kinase [Spirillospora sp. CA-294931]|uniref:serine/threonine-protein kinase n=1 Tax=Spirillospora sp. CA-294931 TaxID=3240042 RepID=UPI003D94149B
MAAVLRGDDPSRLGGYELLGRLGEGGQGTVFLGRDRSGTEVAIKLLRPELAANEIARTRFMREVEVAMRVASFCTAQVLDVGVQEGQGPFIVSEYVRGPSLAEKIAEVGPLAGGNLERVAVGMATALVAIHQAGVVHRDLKPHNVLLGPAGARVIDFGIARALDASTLTGKIIGTPVYMAPEQVRGERPGPAIDVFAWAATVVFAANGTPPFGNDSLPAVVNRILHNEPELGALTGPLRDQVRRCLAKDPAHRPEAHEVLLSLLGRNQTPAVTTVASPIDGTVDTGILALGLQVAAQNSIPPTHSETPPPFTAPAPIAASPTPPGPQTPPPFAASAMPPAPGAPFTPPPPPFGPPPHADTIPAVPPQGPPARRKGRHAGGWAAASVVVAALVAGLVLAVPQVVEAVNQGEKTPGRGGTSHTPMKSVQDAPADTAPEDDDDNGAYVPSTSATPAPTQPTVHPTPSHTQPTWRPSATPSPTHTPTPPPTPTPTPSPTDDPKDSCTGTYPPPADCE